MCFHSIPEKWKNTIKNNRISENFLFLNHHFIKCNTLLKVKNQTSYDSTRPNFCKPTSQIYFEKHFDDCLLDWKYIYLLACIDPYKRYFQYKVLSNVLYLNEKFFFGISETSQYSFCNENKEIIDYLVCTALL